MSQDSSPIVFVVDDEPVVCQSLVALLSGEGHNAQSFPSAEDFLKDFESSRCGCLIADVRLPNMSGIELMRELSKSSLHPPVILISGHSDIPICVQAMKEGAFHFLEKPYRPFQLLDIVRSALEYDAKTRREQRGRHEKGQRLARLAPDELVVLKGIVAGKTSRDIAAEMDVSLRTIEYRRARIMEKLNVSSKAEMVAIAISAIAAE